MTRVPSGLRSFLELLSLSHVAANPGFGFRQPLTSPSQRDEQDIPLNKGKVILCLSI